MNITLLDQRKSAVFMKLRSNAARIRRRCTMLLDELSNYDVSDSFIEEDAFTLKVHEQKEGQHVLAEYNSQVGRGRFVMSWGRDEESILGIVTFQAASIDERDQTEWTSKFDLMVPAQGAPYGLTDDRIFTISIDNKYGNQLSNAILDVHVAILGALTAPQ
jgi:hypothetical protein